MRFVCAIPNLNSFYLINAVERVGYNTTLISYAMIRDEKDGSKFEAYLRQGAQGVKRTKRGRLLKGVEAQ